MSFEITITETRQVEKKRGKEWEKIGEKEVVREGHFETGGEPKTRITAVMDYTPEIVKTVEEKVEVFRQTVGELDLKQVIRAVNEM